MYLPARKTTLWQLGLLALLVTVIWLIVLLGPILTPFIASAILAYMLNPLVEKLCRLRVRRSLAAMVIMMLSLGLLVVVLLIIVPMLIDQFHNIIEKAPQFIHWINNKALPWFNQRFNTHHTLDTHAFIQLWQNHAGTIQAALKKLTPLLIKQSGSVVIFAVNIALLPILLYYFLLDWPRWSSGFKQLIPRRWFADTQRIMNELDKVLGEFLRGQLMVMIIMGIIYGTGLSLVGLENGFAIGMVAGLLVFIPYLGSFTGLLLATVAAILQFHALPGILWVWGVFIAGQTIESYFATPYLVGERIGLSPLTVIFALMAFGQLLGFVGMLLALPMAAMCVVLCREAIRVYFQSRLYQNK